MKNVLMTVKLFCVCLMKSNLILLNFNSDLVIS